MLADDMACNARNPRPGLRELLFPWGPNYLQLLVACGTSVRVGGRELVLVPDPGESVTVTTRE